MHERGGRDEYFRKALGRLFVITAAVGCGLFGAAGTAQWGCAWLFIGTYVLMMGTLSGAMFWNSPPRSVTVCSLSSGNNGLATG